MKSGYSRDVVYELHVAVRENNIERVTALLRSGTDVNEKDANNNTALHIAAELGYQEVVKVLLQTPGINITQLNDDDKSAIQVANAKAAQYRANLRQFMELPENKDKPLLKSDSNFEVITQMILNHKKSQHVIQGKQEGKKSKEQDEKASVNAFKKLILKFTNVDMNLGLMNLSDVFKLVIVENYAPSKKNRTSSDPISPEMSRLNNPLFFVNACLSFVNIGTRVLIDKIGNKITKNARARPWPATIAKAVLTTPISLVQLVVGGVAESINWLSQLTDKLIDRKQKVKDSHDAQEGEYDGKAKYKPIKVKKSPAAIVSGAKISMFKRGAKQAAPDAGKKVSSVQSSEFDSKVPGRRV